MQETIVLDGKRIRLDVHEPEAADKAAPAIVLIHGSGGNVDFWAERIAPHTSAAGVALFAPHYFDRTDTTRATYEIITDGHHFPLWLDTLRQTLDMVAARPSIDRSRIALVGVSLGALLGLSFAAECSASDDAAERCKMRCVVDLSGLIAPQYMEKATANFPPTLIVHGEDDTVVPVRHAYEVDEMLTRLGVPHQLEILPGEDHWYSAVAQTTLLLKLANFLGKYLL